MGGKQSKRSVDITTTPKKGEVEISGETEGKVEKIEDVDVKVATNGGVNHADIEYADNVENEVEKVEKEKGDAPANEDEKPAANIVEEPKASVDEDLSSPTEKPVGSNDEKSPEIEETADKDKKKKDKKRKWSFRSISFSKKDKSKPAKECDKTEEMKEAEEGPEDVASPTVEECQSPKDVEEKVNENTETVAKESNETNVEEDQPSTEEVKPAVEAKNEAPVEIKTEPPCLEVIEEKSVKEEASEEIPPPLPTSNPPSEVIESIKAEPEAEPEPIPALVEESEQQSGDDFALIPSNTPETQTVEESTPAEPEPETEETETVVTHEVETEAANIITLNDEVIEMKEPEADAKVSDEDQTSLPQPLSEVVANSDSIPDISTESLPSLPEPLSETLPEPTSLPSLDAVPNPITESFTEPDLLDEDAANKSENGHAIMTNGNTNGHLSPENHMNGDAEHSIEEPVIQVKSPSDLIEGNAEDKLEVCEVKKGENTAEAISAASEE